LAAVGYEAFERTGFRVEYPSISLVPDGRIAINAAACRILLQARIKSVLLLWDKSVRRIALKAATASDKNAFSVSLTGSHSGTIRARAFLDHIGWHGEKRETIPAEWNDRERMLEASLPASPAVSEQLPSKTIRRVKI
jgi:hypothetical protein